MCGIIGYNGKSKCLPIILSGLKSLEYRGYDSAGVAYLKNEKIEIIKEKGEIENLKKLVDLNEETYLGVGHTRWATHGSPCKENSHPHKVGRVTVVHNGIIENYAALKKKLNRYTFKSETDTEVVAALIDSLLDKNSMLTILKNLNKKLKGSYALGIIVDGDDKLYTIRKDSPLIIGISDDGNFIASDMSAILKYTKKYYILLNDEYAVIEKDKVSVYSDGKLIDKELKEFQYDMDSAMKNGYAHFMLKEIYEQPKVLKDTINEYIDSFKSLKKRFKGLEKYTRIDIVGCGSAYHVGLVGASLIKKYGDIPANAYIASEYRYEKSFYDKNHLVIIISQSGETADTLAVLRNVKEQNIDTIAIVNVVGSSIAREADKTIYIKAGPEISVATTKAYTCQLAILSLMAAYLGIIKKNLDESILNEFNQLSRLTKDLLKDVDDVKEVSRLIHNSHDIFYLGRKTDYSLCMEASLKLKEISYIHSDAYAAGEIKHGTISLIEEKTPVISIITCDEIRSKTISNVEEVKARGALSIVITDDKNINEGIYDKLIVVAKKHELIESILVVIKCQLIAYYVAKLNKCSIDKPRNLAKSVTVE